MQAQGHDILSIDPPQVSQAESIECKNEMDPFAKLIDPIFTEQMYLN